MKVRLAVQVLSSSCARALEYLRKSGLSDFIDSLATETFVSKLDLLFDILNSKSLYAKGYKAVLSTEKYSMQVAVLKSCKDFLLQLQDSTGKRIVYTKRRTFVIGLCTTINSVLYLMENLFFGQGVNGVKLKYLMTYKLCQDNIETLFSIIRRRGGWSNNPTALQFSHAYRAILSHVGVVSSLSSSVAFDCSDDILGTGESSETSNLVLDNDYLSDESNVSTLPMLSSYVENVCSYIAGFVVKKLLPRCQCSTCRQLLVGVATGSNMCFVRLRDNGGLVTPSQSVVSIVQCCERYFRLLTSDQKPVHSVSKLGLSLETAVMSDIDISQVFENTDHLLDTACGIDNHVSSLVRQIVRFYLNIKKFHIVKSWNIAQRGTCVRQKMTKLVLFKNQ